MVAPCFPEQRIARDYSRERRIFGAATKVMLRRVMFPVIGLAIRKTCPWGKTHAY
jgi:hypothetical protein